MTEPILCAQSVAFSYGTRRILVDASLSVAPGTVVGLLGPNGTGKSTLLGLLAGDLAPSSGQVTLAGRPMESYSRTELARMRAVMPQTSDFPFAYTVADIVHMGRAGMIRLRKLRRSQPKRCVQLM